MPTYHNPGDPVGRLHPVNPKEPPPSARGLGIFTVALACAAMMGALYALVS